MVNIVTFLLYGWDKRQARHNKPRIPEKTLLTLVFFGGSVGALLGAGFFRHKTRKFSYIFKFVFILLVQSGIIYLFLYA